MDMLSKDASLALSKAFEVKALKGKEEPEMMSISNDNGMDDDQESELLGEHLIDAIKSGDAKDLVALIQSVVKRCQLGE